MIVRSRPVGYTLLTLLVACSVFSYLPVVQAGKFHGINLDFSFLYVLLLGTVCAALPELWHFRSLVWSHVAVKLLILFQLYVSISVIWSNNPVRASITAGFGWLVILAACSVVAYSKQLKSDRQKIEQYGTVAVAAVCAFSFWQLIGDTLHLPASLTLLPGFYQGDIFGIARPTGFSLEPQFLGSLLLIPFGIALMRSLTTRQTRSMWGLLLLSSLLVFTISRGAALGAIVIFIIVAWKYWPGYKRFFHISIFASLGVVIALCIITTFASIRSGSLNGGYATLRAVTEQFTLGTISLPQQPNQSPSPTSQSTATPATTPQYVAESTTSRLSMSQVATKIWQTSPLFGVGIGGFGGAASKLSPEFSQHTIANNYYLEMLAELGIVGIVLFIGFISSLLYRLALKKQWLLLALCLGALTQWTFFSGNANVIHVWLLFGFALAASLPHAKKPMLAKTSATIG